jgi:hypothetical protein
MISALFLAAIPWAGFATRCKSHRGQRNGLSVTEMQNQAVLPNSQ